MLNKRQAILDTATRLFYAHGYHAIGVDRIIADAGVAKMTMYKHFPSKVDLIGAVLRERDSRFRASLFAFVDTFSTPLDKLRAVFTWHDAWLKEATFNGCMFISAAAEYPDPDDEIHRISKQHKESIREHITEILKEIAAEDVARNLGAQLLQILEGAIVTGLVFTDRDAATTAWRTAAATLRAAGLSVELDGVWRFAQ